jgi:hypothetical protein
VREAPTTYGNLSSRVASRSGRIAVFEFGEPLLETPVLLIAFCSVVDLPVAVRADRPDRAGLVWSPSESFVVWWGSR